MNKELSSLFARGVAADFLSFREGLKQNYKTLTGCGVDYSKGEVEALKIYHKVFSKDLIGIEFFTDWFFKDLATGHSSIENALRKSSKKLLTSKGGLGGINFAVKIPRFGKPKKAIYIKQRGGAVKVLNFDKGIISSLKYKYIFNKFLIKLVCRHFKLNVPDNPHGIEYSVRKKAVNCSVYPNYKLKDGDLLNFLTGVYKHLSSQNPWEIEEEIVSSFGEIMPQLVPITKGYCSRDSFRKIFLGIKEDIL